MIVSSSAKSKVLKWDIESLAKFVSDIVAKESGNVLGSNQQSMVVNRLKKRLLTLQLGPEDYYQYLNDNYLSESKHLVTILTTHHTFFFREYCHFEYLEKNLDSIIKTIKNRGESKVRVLSAACSRGQEVYSLAMFFEHHLKNFPGMSYEIVGTDIDPESVKIAQNGVYPYKEVKTIPQLYLSGNWQRGTGEIASYAKVKSHLKEKCHFTDMNLLSVEKTLMGKKFDLILCRNVFIYFESQVIKEIVNKLKSYLFPEGLLITGLSESLKSLDITMNTHAPSVYSFGELKPEEEKKTPKSKKADDSKVVASKPTIPSPIKLLVVDDSSSVLKLLSKIFSTDPEFELVGTAKNGVEAEDFLKSNKVDAMTLDIHMPEMDGVQYLKKNFKKGHPHVVVVSSASREDTQYAQETLNHGACDFVEKPALNNLMERAEEIKIKLKMAFINQESSQEKTNNEVFKTDFTIEDCTKKSRLLFGTYSDLKKVTSLVSKLKGNQPPILFISEGNENFLEITKKTISDKYPVSIYGPDTELKENHIYVCDFSKDFSTLSTILKDKKSSISILGICSKKVCDAITDFNNAQVLVEDIPGQNKELVEVASDVFPWTSFGHIATEFLAGKD